MQIIGSHIVSIGETRSTNEYVIQLLKKTRPDNGSVFITDKQTHGRGMETNSWESEPGKNLTFSIILYPDFLAVEKQFLLNQAVAIGISELVRELVPNNLVTIKWPNDIYIGDKKVCGTLIQNSIMGKCFDYVVVGIGLNVNQVVFKSPAPNPVSLANCTNRTYDLNILLNDLCNKLDAWYQRLLNGDQNTIHLTYYDKLYRVNQWKRYSVRGEILEARITGISDFGHLVLEDRYGKLLTCDVKEVVYL